MAPFSGVETFVWCVVLDEDDEDTNECGFFCFENINSMRKRIFLCIFV
jgi:hypothetical protein